MLSRWQELIRSIAFCFRDRYCLDRISVLDECCGHREGLVVLVEDEASCCCICWRYSFAWSGVHGIPGAFPGWAGFRVVILAFMRFLDVENI